VRAGLRHRLRAERAKKTFEMKLTQSHIIYRSGNWYMRFAGSWSRITQIGIAPNRNDIELCKDRNGLIFPHIIGRPQAIKVVSRCRVDGDLLLMDLENGLRSYWDLSMMDDETRRMLLVMLKQAKQADPTLSSMEGMTVNDWIVILQGGVTV
jgi:hypothetical protein